MRHHRLVGGNPDKGIAADVLAALDTLQQKRLGRLIGDAQKRRNRSFEVSRNRAIRVWVFASLSKSRRDGLLWLLCFMVNTSS